MKIAFNHLSQYLDCNPDINDVSEKLFQLGHEHEIENNILDMEFTPNRGDCLSVNGLLRDLAAFYKINLNQEYYNQDIPSLSLDFKNEAKNECPKISFLKLEISESVLPYNDSLKNYFKDLKINSNNFFTDVSNYISYETGQPTHCYDLKKIGETISLKNIEEQLTFDTLLGTKIELNGKNLVFVSDKKVVNLAGVIGGKDTACSDETKSVLVECAYFNPEAIIGKSLKYDIQSEAAHKFERSTDQMCHEQVLRRFLYVISEHAEIKSVELYQHSNKDFVYKYIPLDIKLVNNIIGINLSKQDFILHLSKIGFSISNDFIKVPSYRNDVETNNDIAEEIARIVGYNNIPISKINIHNNSDFKPKIEEGKVKSFLVDHGFYEVINNPFSPNQNDESIKVDNPLDSNRKFLRTSLKESLINNLLYNERRQHESVKLFEISDIYQLSKIGHSRKVIGIVASGRLGKNFKDFSKKINSKYLHNIFGELTNDDLFSVEIISRDSVDSKLKNEICYIEIDLDNLLGYMDDYSSKSSPPIVYSKYKPISNYPSSTRDLSFSLSNSSKLKDLEHQLLSFRHINIKDSFVFDYYINEVENQTKLGFRFVFQSYSSTLLDRDVDAIMETIIDNAIRIDGVTIPGRG
jgi:phenylalanyl-tRNA synthetase beta chain